MKKWIILAVVLAGGAWGFQKWRTSLPGTSSSASDARPSTAVVETRDIHFAVSAAGEIGPADQVSVRPEINGKILTLPVDIGDRVKKDSVLFTLDDQDLQTERSSRLIEIEAAKLQLEKAKRDYERSKQLYADKLISQELFDDTRTQYELARNALDRTEKALHLIDYRPRQDRAIEWSQDFRLGQLVVNQVQRLFRPVEGVAGQFILRTCVVEQLLRNEFVRVELLGALVIPFRFLQLQFRRFNLDQS